ncbi:hypothetical protein SCOR_30510 [Sulfidibacter corallicola]|uniref:Uncharacterized protein n=1 Tax=Sulfidibacter corallicola TaxID=2818388 RepID=A0A8A4TMI4_SULCO|nr:hypothetical protein [Sulfidibacter corallicola]QTD50108.1 hypothetical protein J3U87_31375 [Sulfidibacter corallicola]
MNDLKSLFSSNLKLLFFKTSKRDFDAFSLDHLKLGLFLTWIVGMGRWWDDPNANILQHLGMGSVIYIFVLAGIIWSVVWPLKPRNWSYRHVLTFVSLTSLPALLYAIPVERFVPISTAISLNIGFLAVVAAWRVALFFFYLSRHADLHWFKTMVVGLLPLSAIVSSLFFLNLHNVVFDIMGGLRDEGPSPHEGEYSVLMLLTMLSVMLIIPLLLTYAGLIYHEHKVKPNRTNALSREQVEPDASLDLDTPNEVFPNHREKAS